jgi:hypothetical protein
MYECLARVLAETLNATNRMLDIRSTGAALPCKRRDIGVETAVANPLARVHRDPSDHRETSDEVTLSTK